jgi:hypothetical protein
MQISQYRTSRLLIPLLKDTLTWMNGQSCLSGEEQEIYG